ncbi:MAG: zinc-dependent metalloprotease family protein [Abyssibacter sp.]|uniref:M12 family metallo-peptidase n=1 Tax=Abyssibacter sp. TaxID=2320200 RepID=UPI00321BAFCC
MRVNWHEWLLLASSLLSACGTNDGGHNQVNSILADLPKVEICEGTLGPNATVEIVDTTLCPTCEVLDLESVADGDWDTFATFRFSQPSGAFVVRGNSKNGNPIEPGIAGLFMGRILRSDGENEDLDPTTIKVNIRTYLDGVLREASLIGSAGPTVGNFTERFILRAFVPTMTFDSIEVQYVWDGATNPKQVRFAEFCTASRPFTEGIPAPVRKPISNPTFGSAGDDGIYEVNLLVLYSERALSQAGDQTALASYAADRVVVANKYFENTELPIRYGLVGTEFYSAASETLTTGDVLKTLQADGAVQKRREQLGADIVALFMTTDLGFDLCGKATAFNGGVQSIAADNVDPRNDGFVVVGALPGRISEPCEDTVLAHELGHVLAGGHEASISSGAYWKPYSHSWSCGRNSDGEVRYTLMSSGGSGDTLADVISSPLILHDGEPCGSDQGDGTEATQADNARAMLEAAPYVSAYSH